jgi:hypothetical protein
LDNAEAKIIAESVARHVADRAQPPAKVFVGAITTIADASGIARWTQDGVDATHAIPVVDKLNVSLNRRCLVQFNPSGSAFVLQTI